MHLKIVWAAFWQNDVEKLAALIAVVLAIGGIVKLAGKKVAKFWKSILSGIDDRLRHHYTSKRETAEDTDLSVPHKGPNWTVFGGPDLNKPPISMGAYTGMFWEFTVPIYICNLSWNMGTGFNLEIHVPGPYRISAYYDKYGNMLGTDSMSPLSDRNNKYWMVSFKHPTPASMQIEQVGSVKLRIPPGAKVPDVFEFHWRLELSQRRYYPSGGTTYWFRVNLSAQKNGSNAKTDSSAPEATT